jgi:hypothetical protein
MSLHTLAHAWAFTQDLGWTGDQSNFVQAFIDNRTASRKIKSKPRDVEMFEQDFRFLSVSRLQATKPRDHILAMAPQNSFYTVPKNARDMTFSELFRNLCTQFNLSNRGRGTLATALTYTSEHFVGRVDPYSMALCSTAGGRARAND